MHEYVRVKDPDTGHEFSLPVGTFDPDTVTVLDKPATDPGGAPLPPKHKTTVAKAAENRAATPPPVKEK